jgi:cytochrome oxidase Cu insertion factor (SCO1/SenC/PrrC family)
MSLEQKLEANIQNTQLKMQQLAISMESLENEYQQLLEDLALTPEQLKDYAEDSSNFSPPIWEQLQNDKKKLDEKLDLALKSVRDPLKIKKTFSDQGLIQRHWIFVR